MNEFGGIFAFDLNNTQVRQWHDAVKGPDFGAIGHVGIPLWLMA